MTQKTLEGKTALMTGGGTGLGLEIGRSLARRGARLAIASRSEEHLETGKNSLEEEGAEVLTLPCDVRDHHAVRRTVSAVTDRYGSVDILVNNAAGNFVRPAERLPEKAFATVTDIVLNGTFNFSRAAGRAMIDRGNGLVRGLAVEWSGRGVRVNAIAPGWIDTAMSRRALEADPDRKDKILRRTPMGRLGEPNDVGWAAVYLCSPQAKFVTGQQLVVDGGASVGF